VVAQGKRGKQGVRRPFSYYGSKHGLAHLYPAPRFSRIVEPFAGSAGYACRWADQVEEVNLYDIDADVVAAWQAVLEHEPKELLQLPQNLDDCPPWAKALVGFWHAIGRSSPATKPSSWMLSGWIQEAYWGPRARMDLAVTCDKLKNKWFVERRPWKAIPELLIHSTIFVDPPYQSRGGRGYRHDAVDYPALGAWCRALAAHGHQVIACEELGADWLPFQRLASIQSVGSRAKTTTHEVVWVSDAQGPR
jgi:site-specific DNA-adenine methylase